MSNRNFDQGYTIGKRLIDVAGSFVPLTSSTGTIVASKVKGLGFGYAPIAGVMTLQTSARSGITSTPGVAHPSGGLYTLTFDDSYREINVISCDLAAPSSGSALWSQPVEPWTNTGVLGAAAGIAPSIQLLTINSSGSPTDVGTPNAFRLHFFVQFEDSTVQFQKP
jgi:hypothetical protein